MVEQLVARLRHEVVGLFAPHDFLAAYAYGSQLTGRVHPGSDLDVGYYLAPLAERRTLSLRAEMLLEAELSDRLCIQVDLRDLGCAPLELRGRVLEEGVRVFSGDDAERVALERGIMARHHDYKDEFRRMHEVRLNRTATLGL